MKKLVIICAAFVLMSQSQLTGQSLMTLEEYISYDWVDTTGVWEYDFSSKYSYADELLNTITDVDTIEKLNLRLQEFHYHEIGKYSSKVKYNWQDRWVFASRNLYTYNEDSLTEAIEIQIYDDVLNDWKPYILHDDHVYDSEGVLQQWTHFGYIEESAEWEDLSTDYLYYNSDGTLSQRINYRANGNPFYQLDYTYKRNNTVMLAQRWNAADGWYNWYRRTTGKTFCGSIVNQKKEIWKDGAWINDWDQDYIYSTEYYYFNKKGQKVVPMTNGRRTKEVKLEDFNKFLNRGWCIDPTKSLSEASSTTVGKGKKKAAIETADETPAAKLNLYPNPASDQIHLRLDDTNYRQLSVFNMNGQLVIQRSLTGAQEVSIQRNNLESGIYILRLTGTDRVETMQFIFK